MTTTLVGGFKHVFLPFHRWDVILPIDFHISFIFFKMVFAPPTSHRQSQLLPVVPHKAVAEVSKIGNL